MMEELKSKKKLSNLKREECREEPMIRTIKKSWIKRGLSFREMSWLIGLVWMISKGLLQRDQKRSKKKNFQKKNKIYEF
jgi:hypothetical protein